MTGSSTGVRASGYNPHPDWDAPWAEVGLPPAGAPKPPKRLGYVAQEGVIALSYSRLNTLYSCPRKFQLSELMGRKSFSPTMHTAFGHAYGAGVQTFLQYAPSPAAEAFIYDFDDEVMPAYQAAMERAEQRAVVAAVAAWDMYQLDPEATTASMAKKSIWEAIHAVRTFCAQEAPALLEEWELAYLPPTPEHPQGKPMIELMFYIQAGRYSYQGHIDIVLRSRATGELCVFEIKTGSKPAAQADWANSSQTLGYNVVLQAFGLTELTQPAYYVKYLCYDASGRTMQIMEFTKSPAERVEWIASILMDMAQMDMYAEHGIWPKRGGSCMDWFRPCEHFMTCDLSTASIAPPEHGSYESMGLDEVDLVLTLEQLLALQE